MEAELLRKIQLAELLILNELDRICREHGIRYYLVGGTLLGAIRHGGFIPWDDDLDVAMERRDYKRFYDVCQSELDGKFFLQNVQTDSHFHMYISKLLLNGTTLVDERAKKLKIKNGIYVDIFPLDYSTRTSGFLWAARAKILNILFGLRSAKLGNAQPISGWKKMLVAPVTVLMFLIPAGLINWLVARLMDCEGEDSKYLMNFCSQYGYKKQTMEKQVYGEPVKLKFENGLYNAPAQYIHYLERIYKDYMKLPPMEKRRTIHEFIEIDLGEYKDIRLEDETLVY
jgi:lipopolysaccharide cholinephosphotransferase